MGVTVQRKGLTVGLPVRNGARFLDACLRNLTDNELDDLVILVSDNASCDATADIARQAAQRDARVQYRRHAVDIGANGNFNFTFRSCRTSLFKWAAVDDLCAPDLLESACEALEDDEGVVLAYGHPRLIDGAGAVLAAAVENEPRAAGGDAALRFNDVLAHEVWCTPIFGVMRTSALRRTSLLRPFYGADKVLLAELSLLGRFVRVPPPFYRRCHDDQSTVLGARAKARWSRGGGGATAVPAVLSATQAYLALAAGSTLPLSNRARALTGVGRMALRWEKVGKLIRPGPYNYLGLATSSSPAAYAGLDRTLTGTFAPGCGPRSPDLSSGDTSGGSA